MRIPSPCVHKPALDLIATPTADLNLFAGQRCRFGCTLLMQPMIPTPSPSHQLHVSGWTYLRDVGPWRSGTTTVSQINWARGDEPYDNRPLDGSPHLSARLPPARRNERAGIASTSPTSGGNGRPRWNRSTAT